MAIIIAYSAQCFWVHLDIYNCCAVAGNLSWSTCTSDIDKQVLPKVIWEKRVALAQLCNKVLVTMGRRKFTPKLPLPLRRSPPKSNTPIPSPSIHHPKRHPDPFSRVAARHVRTDRWDKRKLYPISAPLIEWRANNSYNVWSILT